MRKATIALAAVLALCVSTGAEAAKKKKAAAPKPAAAATNPNASGIKLVGDAWSQLLVPAQSMQQKAAAPAKPAAKGKKKKA
jgi:hypothetical protein